MTDQAKELRKKLHNTNKKNRCKTISIVSGKGGVGKSTTVLNFAIQTQRLGKKVLIFDFDIGMGNIDILLGQQSTYTIANFFDDFLPIHDMIELGPKNLSYIAGGSGFNHLVTLSENKLNYFFTEYEKLTEEYDYIFFDIGAGVTEDTLSLILASDECFIITTPEPTSIADAYSMIKHIVLKNKQLPLFVLMNRSETIKEGNDTIKKLSRVVKKFLNKDLRALGSLPYDQTVLKSVKRQIPYTLLKENAPVSKAMKAIVEQYLSLKRERSKPDKPTFIDRLRRLLLMG